MNSQKLLVHLLASHGCNRTSRPAAFGYCLLDQLLEQRSQLTRIAELDHPGANDHSRNKTSEAGNRNSDTSQSDSSDASSAERCSTAKRPSHLTSFVSFSLETNVLVLSEAQHASKSTYILRHPEFCPARLQHQQDPDGAPPSSGEACPDRSTSQGIAVGVSVLTQSADGKVLLTRRARHMRTFPGLWVPPGGHVEVGESLEAAAARELAEETGVVLPPDRPVEVLGMWESVYPPVLGLGAPVRQHLVVYLLATVDLPAHAVPLQLQAKEVEAGLWLSAEQVAAIMGGQDSPEEGLQPFMAGVVLNELGDTVPGDVDTSRLKPLPLSAVADFSRLSTGSRYALSLWLERQSSVAGGCPHASL